MEKTDLSHNGHRQRVREIVEKGGLKYMPDYQKLEFILFGGIPYKDTKPIAYELLRKFGSLKNVFNAPIDELVSVKNMTRNAAIIVRSYAEIFDCVFCDNRKILTINNILPFVFDLFANDKIERLILVCIKDTGEVLSTDILSYGNTDNVVIPTETIARKIVVVGAKKVFLAHNHPSDSITPSPNDLQSNEIVEELCTRMNVEFIDHFIVGENCIFSCDLNVRLSASEDSVYPSRTHVFGSGIKL